MEAKTTNSQIIIQMGQQQSKISPLYEKVKSLRNSAIGTSNIDPIVEEIQQIQSELKIYGDNTGPIFCEKETSIVLRNAARVTKDVNKRLNLLDRAYNHATEAVVMADKKECKQPSIPKNKAVIASELSAVLHETGNHYDANFLQNDALKALKKLKNEYPDYPEVYIELVTASLNALQWQLAYTLSDLVKAEHLILKPKHTKHVPSMSEKASYPTAYFKYEEYNQPVVVLFKITL